MKQLPIRLNMHLQIQKTGKISISLTHISDSQLLLSISDNGRGLPTNF